VDSNSSPGLFQRFARWAADQAGQPYAFIVALAIVLAWISAGPIFGFTNTLYQLFINTLTTIITFLMTFLIQGSQNRDTKEVKLQLAELVRAVQGANNTLVSLDRMTDNEIEAVRKRIAARAQRED
jgi:low affinity Fe/Cu permease